MLEIVRRIHALDAPFFTLFRSAVAVTGEADYRLGPCFHEHRLSNLHEPHVEQIVTVSAGQDFRAVGTH